ncbi:MAG: DUF2169 domain-containing protein [Sandaracinaceae bacterium]
MDLIHATPMNFGFLTWPFRPGKTSMVLVMKASFEIVNRGFARLAETQPHCHGPVYFDDDPEQSLRLEGDFALVKPAGEMLLAGSCHPPDAPTPVSTVAVSVGPVRLGLGVIGDRHWKGGVLGASPTEPLPFESMPLRWERAFGGPGIADNPQGCGLEKVERDGKQVVPLPNLEQLQRPIASPKDRPRPAAAFPIAPTWPSRLARAGTYDRVWTETRFPYFPDDFDPRFFHAAPELQRLRGRFWTGTEEIAIRHLLPGRPFVTTRLPGLRARGFVEREIDGRTRFSEVPLVLDTIVVDGDSERIVCTWRGSVEVADKRLSNVSRLFLMHDPVDSGRSEVGCRERMEAHLRLRQIEESGFEASNPTEDQDARTMVLEQLQKTLAGDPKMRALLDRAMLSSVKIGAVPDATLVEEGDGGADAPDAPDVALEGEAVPEPPSPDAVLEDVYAKLESEGIDMTEHRAKLAAIEEKAPPPLPDPDALRDAYAASGLALPDEVAMLLEDLEEVRQRRDAPEPEAAPLETPVDARSRLLNAYTEGRSIEGDFSGVDLEGEDLSGAVLNKAILAGANLRGCVLAGAKLDGAVLTGAMLEQADLMGASLVGADLTRAVLNQARLSEADLTEATLDDAKLAKAHLVGATLIKAEGARVDLREAVLEGASLDEADLPQAWLAHCKARGASFVDARLWGTFAQDADFTECDLSKLRAGSGSRFDRARFRGAKADKARFFDAIFSEANFSFASLEGADFSRAQLIGAVFAGCRMKKARFVSANLFRAEMPRCDLMKANLMDALLDDADLRGSSLFGAELLGARTSGTRFELAALDGTKLADRGGSA